MLRKKLLMVENIKVQIIDVDNMRLYRAIINGHTLLHETTDTHLNEREFRELAIKTYHDRNRSQD